ncbi:type II toxin-antitoxin system HipA family toxin YjjJ [Erwinia tasmaniensis]|uniref:HipA-like C-terminal domain-containing protein n=1 Tax=Erwinia tasmaniensis (strain DSM 17950 / CFBP 7177 / CIP 109463 / NCPPB 4357 / Et1/99) TaxID=465817 RepID=B2VH25_ERWT9|nr:type II toxin-antitoxin system HipA family toxin YjjJ [Erwinia tasmaniensis]CAO95716.1 Conserved hypothetical protein YjjJ [Erwinia tasmaniensis Et1/99]
MSELTTLLLQGPLDAASLQARLGISQATLSRLIKAQPQVLKYGRARATRYALLRPLREVSQFPLWQIDSVGQAHAAGQLYRVWPAGSCVVQDANASWRYYPGLPWYLSDMRPQGFLGRLWGRDCARLLGLPEDIRQWNDDHCLLALSSRGADVTGSWLIGQHSYQQWLQRSDPAAVLLADKATCYPRLAGQVLAGEQPGSSAGGEQPKFASLAELPDGSLAPVLVKFTPARTNENSQRWCDLLRAEALALRLMQQHGLAAARATVIAADSGQLFLEVVRFDREGENGRRSMVSLEAVQAEFIGHPNHWPAALRQLVQQKRLSEHDAQRGILQWAFGRLIANGDMHAGNLSFFLNDGGLGLTPAYDMLPMSFAPNSAGYMRDGAVALRLDDGVSQQQWQTALEMAGEFWQSISAEGAFSAGFRQLAAEMQQQLSGLAARIARMA